MYTPFLFLYFLKTFFYRNIFLVSYFTVLYPYRPAGGRQGSYRPAGGDMDLHVNKYNFFVRRPLAGACRPHAGWQSPAARWSGGRQPAPPAGGWQAPPNIKAEPLPSPSFPAHEIQRGERERGGVREVKKPAKPCRIFIRTAGNQYFSTLSFQIFCMFNFMR